MAQLTDKKVALLTENGFEQVELTSPKNALEAAGATVHIISTDENDTVKAWDKTDWGITVPVDKKLSEVKPENYDALLLPGGVMNPDKLRMNKEAVAFVKSFVEAGKPIAAICHAPQLLIETGLLKGRNLTSYWSLQTDLKNAGANWSDEAVVTDNGLVTSRSPDDLDAFNSKMIEEISEGQHEQVI